MSDERFRDADGNELHAGDRVEATGGQRGWVLGFVVHRLLEAEETEGGGILVQVQYGVEPGPGEHGLPTVVVGLDDGERGEWSPGDLRVVRPG